MNYSRIHLVLEICFYFLSQLNQEFISFFFSSADIILWSDQFFLSVYHLLYLKGEIKGEGESLLWLYRANLSTWALKFLHIYMLMVSVMLVVFLWSCSSLNSFSLQNSSQNCPNTFQVTCTMTLRLLQFHWTWCGLIDSLKQRTTESQHDTLQLD